MYQDVALFAFRYLGMKTLEEVDRMTIPEYLLHAKAQAYRNVDARMSRYQTAYLTQAAKSTTGTGKNAKPKYSTFKKFFDYEKELKRIEQKPGSTNKHWREYRKRKGENYV